MSYFRSLIAQLVRDEKGQTAVEYGLVLALVAVVVVGALALGADSAIDAVVTKITNAINPPPAP